MCRQIGRGISRLTISLTTEAMTHLLCIVSLAKRPDICLLVKLPLGVSLEKCLAIGLIINTQKTDGAPSIISGCEFD